MVFSKKAAYIKKIRYWLFSLLLFCPVLLLYSAHFIVGFRFTEQIPTGFIQYDMPYYMANAREYSDSATLNVFYSSPFTHIYENPKIYFQPHIFFLAILFYLTHGDPGILFVFFGLVAGVCCIRIIIQIYNELFGMESFYQKVGLVIFCWGGGILAIVGIVYNILSNYSIEQAVEKAFIFDPYGGWWFLNLGRNLVFPTEAYYHLLFLGAVYCVLKKKLNLCLFLTLVLSMSHPFTGVELILIILFWSLLEIMFLQNIHFPRRIPLLTLLLLFFHIGYYILYLNSFAEHKMLMKQWSLPWTLEAVNFIPAYFLVAGLAFYNTRNVTRFKILFTNEFNRFCLVWFIVAFALANHEFAINPIQPLHFTRGYIWTPLCLLGMNFLLSVLKRIWYIKGNLIRYLLIYGISIIFLFDNILWVGVQSYLQLYNHDNYLGKDMQSVFHFINDNKFTEYYVVSQDLKLGYWLTAYTPLRSWLSHTFNTPDAEEKKTALLRFYKEGILHSEWKNSKVLFVFDKLYINALPTSIVEKFMLENKKVFENTSYIIYNSYN